VAVRPRTWREALERIAFAYRGFVVAHPNVLPLLVGRLPIGPHALTIRERSLAALTARGFSHELAARAFTTLLQYVVGSSVTQAGSPTPVEAAAIRDYYRSLDPAAYPHVAAAAEALTRTPAEAGFVEGLEIVLDGIDRIRRRSAR
jgi:Tetracyclin repressor-like, C-terminal domain